MVIFMLVTNVGYKFINTSVWHQHVYMLLLKNNLIANNAYLTVQVNWSKKTKRFTCKNIGPECARNSCMCDEQLAYALSQVVMKICMHQIGGLIMKVHFS